jgi:hypothetical protein
LCCACRNVRPFPQWLLHLSRPSVRRRCYWRPWRRRDRRSRFWRASGWNSRQRGEWRCGGRADASASAVLLLMSRGRRTQNISQSNSGEGVLQPSRRKKPGRRRPGWRDLEIGFAHRRVRPRHRRYLRRAEPSTQAARWRCGSHVAEKKVKGGAAAKRRRTSPRGRLTKSAQKLACLCALPCLRLPPLRDRGAIVNDSGIAQVQQPIHFPRPSSRRLC